MIRVTQENQEILKRILAREPEYNRLEWDKQWEENEEFMDNISRYPRDWWELEQKEKELRKQELREVSSSFQKHTGFPHTIVLIVYVHT